MSYSNHDGQRTVYTNIGKRGYFDHWTLRQLFMRQLVKLLEETAEAFLSITWPVQFTRLREYVLLVKDEARRVFDDKTFWVGVNSHIPVETIGELTDVQVVLCTAACAYEDEKQRTFHLIRSAANKSKADIERGVRNGK